MCIVWSPTGALLPFTSREDVDFFSHLEMHLRAEAPPLAGRDHMAYRSAYFPVKDAIDGDLCEQYAQVCAGLGQQMSLRKAFVHASTMLSGTYHE